MFKEFIKNVFHFFILLIVVCVVVVAIVDYVIPWIVALQSPYKTIATVIGISLLGSIFGGVLSFIFIFYEPENKEDQKENKTNSYDELKLIKELWKRGWANDKAQETIRQECVRVCKYFAKVDEAYNSYATFDIIPDLDIIKVTLEIERNVTYTRYIPLRSLTLPPEELYNKKTCRMLLKEGNDIWVKSQKTNN